MLSARRLLGRVSVVALGATLLLPLLAGPASAGGGISGRVTGPDGQPLAGVEVHAHVANYHLQPRDMFANFPPGPGGLVSWTVTAADGTYEFADLEATPAWQPGCDSNSPTNFGHYVILFSPPRDTGFLPKVFRGRRGPLSPVWNQLTVEEGKTITGVDVQLGPPASIAGTVTRPDGPPVSGATVAVEVEPLFDLDLPGMFVTRTTTDGMGRYVLTGVEYNDYWLRVTVPGGVQPYVFYPGTADPVRVRPLHGGLNDGFDVTVQTPGSILVDDPSGHGAWAEGFASPQGPSVFDSDPEAAPHNVQALPPGTYRVAMSSSPPWSVTWYPGTFQWEEATPVVVRSGETTAISLSPAPLGTVTGRVVDGAGVPVADVAVGVTDLSPCYPPQVTYTDAEGNFALLSGGDRKLSFSKEGCLSVWYNGQPDQDAADFVRFRSGETTALGDIVLESRGAPGGIAGVVTAGGAPLAGARVEVWSSPAGSAALATVTPAADGSFVASGLVPGPYLVRFFDSTPASAFGERWHTDAVSPATATPVNVQPGLVTGGIDADLDAVGSISGTITVDGQPPDIYWFQDDLCLADVLGKKVRCAKPSSLDGTYRFDGVAPGTYLLAIDVTMHYSAGRWYPDEPSAATAQHIAVAPGEAVAGIDANLQAMGVLQVPLSTTCGGTIGYYHLVDADTSKVCQTGYLSPGLPKIWAYPGRYHLVYSSLYRELKHYPQWYPGKGRAADAEIVDVLPGQTLTLADTVLEFWGCNRAPTLSDPASLSATEGLPSSFTLDATDPDGDLLTFSAANLPQGASFDPYTGAFSWTPTCTQAGAYPDVAFTVTDHGNPPLSASATMAVSVAGRDCAPVLDPIGAQSVVAGEALSFQITASDPEGDPIVLEAGGLPAGASFNLADGTFSWTPGTAQVGVYDVTFAAAYAADTSVRDQEVVAITVLERTPPVLDPIGPRSVIAGESLSFQISASDPLGDPVVLEASGLTAGATFNAADGTFSWTPTTAQIGVHNVTFAAAYAGDTSLRDEEIVAITVLERAPPVLDPIGARSVVAGEPLTFQITASDPEGDPIVLEASGLPAGASFNAADGTFSWTPSTAQVGGYDVTFAAAYAGDTSLRDEEIVAITVLERAPPVLDPIGARSVVAGESLTFQISASDPLGDPVVLEASGLPAGASFNAADGTFSWTPDGTQGGIHPVTFAAAYAADPSVRDEEVVAITVLGPLLFSDGFAHGDLPADPDWVTVAGSWSVRSGTFRSRSIGSSAALTGPSNLAGTEFAAGRIGSRVLLGPRTAGTPNLAFVFGYRDPQHYRYVRFFPGATEIGQVGEIDGQPALRLRRSRGLASGRWQRVRVDLAPNGLVRVLLGDSLLGGLKFPTAVPGAVGVMTRNSQCFVDDFSLWSRVVLN